MKVRPVTSRERDERGVIIVLTSLLILALLTFTAFSVDIGHESEVKRHLHAVSDIAAEDGLYGLGSTTALSKVVNIAVGSAKANGHPMAGSNQLTVEIGTWTPSAGFQTLPCDSAPCPPCVVTVTATSNPAPSCVGHQEKANAVKVTASNSLVWNFVSGSQGLSALAVASPDVLTGLEVGTFDASTSLTASQTSLLNAALGISGVSYDGLAGATLNANDLATALGFGTPNDMFHGTTTYKRLLDAAGDALSKNGDTTGAATLKGISTKLGSGTVGGGTVQLGPLFGATTSTGAGSALAGNGGIDALGLLTAGYDASVINGTTFASLNGLNLSIPGVASVDSGVKLIQAPNFKYGGSCGVTTPAPSNAVDCAQVHSAQLEGQILVHLPPVSVSILGIGTATISGDIPLYFDNAGAHAWVSSYCSSFANGHQSDVTAWANSGVAHVAFGQNAGIVAGTAQQDVSIGAGGSVSIQSPTGNVSVAAGNFLEVSIPATATDVKLANNNTVSVLDTGPTLLQPSSAPPPPPTVASYSGPFIAASGSPGYRGPDRLAATTYQFGGTVSPPDPAGKALGNALTALANSLPTDAQVSAQLQAGGLSAAIATSLSVPLSTEMSTIRSVLASLDQTVFAPLSATFQAAIAGAVVTNLAAQNQTPPNGTLCIPKVVQ